MGWKDDLAAARADLHEQFGQSATYLEAGVTVTAGALVSVRVHDKTLIKGDINGFGYGEKVLDVPQVIFLASEVPAPLRGATVTLDSGEVYRLDVPLAPHGITIPVEASRIDTQET